jgi:hypothetical protein
MQIKFISPYILIIFLGITGLILTLIAATLSSKFHYSDNIFEFLNNLNDKFQESKFEFYFEILFVTPIYSFIMFMQIIFELLVVLLLNIIYLIYIN